MYSQCQVFKKKQITNTFHKDAGRRTPNRNELDPKNTMPADQI